MPDPTNFIHSKFTEWYFSRHKTDVSKYVAVTSTTKEQLYLVVLGQEKYVKIPFQFVPNEINYDRNIDMQEIKPIMRNLPNYQYTGGSTIISFTLDFFANLDSRQDVIDRCREIEALGYTDGYDNDKPLVKLVWGGLFREEKWEILSIRAKYSEFKPESNFLPQQAYVDISLGLVSDVNPKWRDIL